MNPISPGSPLDATIIAITGTDTDVGKTIVTAAIAARLVAAARTVAIYKPTQTGLSEGEPGDAQIAAELSGASSFSEGTRLLEPLAPTMAARRADVALPALADHREAILRLAKDHDHVLVEGAGGILVGIGNQDETLVDLLKLLPDASIIVAVRAALGTLNHSLLTTRLLDVELPGDEATRPKGLVVGSLPTNAFQPTAASPPITILDTPVASSWELEVAHANQIELQRLTGWPLLGSIPAGSGRLTRSDFKVAAPRWFLEAGIQDAGSLETSPHEAGPSA